MPKQSKQKPEPTPDKTRKGVPLEGKRFEKADADDPKSKKQKGK